MKAPIKWLKDFVDINVSPKEYADALTLSGSKVEAIEQLGEAFEKVVVGKIVSLEKHPDADKLNITQVDVGSETLQVVTGAPNIKLGDYIPLALPGACLPGGKIKKAKLRGVESNGMMCSIEELNLTKDQFPDAPDNGVYIFNDSPKPGSDIKEVMGLDETVIEFEITSNRPDCLSILGLARETAVTLSEDFKTIDISVKEKIKEQASDFASVDIKNKELCSRYAARVVKNVKIESSPKWMQQRLSAAGMRPINNIVDITNYVMLEMGQPMHAFDLEKVDGGVINVRRASDGEEIITLDSQKRKLDSNMLVIADNKKAIAIAGVMGGENSEVTENTNTLLLESATFEGSCIRKTAKKLGLRSEASSRFEKGLDVENVISAIDRAAQLIEELGAGDVCKGVIDNYAVKKEKKIVKLNQVKINEFLGTDISKEQMIEIFENLEFVVDKETNEMIVPSFRQDIEYDADIAEEVARFYDYNNIKPTLKCGLNATVGEKTYSQKLEDIIKSTLVSCGLYEIYTFSFTSPKVFDKVNMPKDSELRNAVAIKNPLGEDYSIMRTTTLPDMLSVISRNYKRKVNDASLFELSKIYLPNQNEELPEEKRILTIGMYGECDFYNAKGVIEELFKVFGINNSQFCRLSNEPAFHPGRTASISIDGKNIGVVGQIHPDVAEKNECPDNSYIATVDIDILCELADLKIQYKQLPKYPSMKRDISMIIDNEILVNEIENAIKEKGGKYLESVKLFDVYKGEHVPEGKKSVAYSIIFRNNEKTLVDEEVNQAMNKILKNLETKLNAQLRE